MAPAACDTICRHLTDFDRKPSDYDAIITGDLGVVGQRILFDLLREKGLSISSIHHDCGLLIFDNKSQDTHSGGSLRRLRAGCVYPAAHRYRPVETCPVRAYRGNALQSKL